MHLSQMIQMADGSSWILAANHAALELLEELFDGAPFFAILGDDEDYRATRIYRLLYAFSFSFRRQNPDLRAMSYREFVESDLVPVAGTEEWDDLVVRLVDFIHRAFPRAVRKGRALLAAARMAQQLGLQNLSPEPPESSTQSSESGPDVPEVTDVTQVSEPTGLSDAFSHRSP